MSTIINDTFTGTVGTLLAAHTGQTGATWTAAGWATGSSMSLTGSGTVQPTSSAECAMLASGTSATGNYAITGSFVTTGSQGSGTAISVWARVPSGANQFNGYYFSLNGNAGQGFIVQKYINAAGTAIVTPTGGLQTADTYYYVWTLVGPNHTIQIQRASDSKYLNSSGTWQTGATNHFSFSDSTFSNGLIALEFYGQPNILFHGPISVADAVASASFTVSPTSASTSTSLAVTATGSHTTWTTGTSFSVSGGIGASISGISVNASTQVATFTLNPGSSAATLTITDTTDAASASITVAVPLQSVAVNDPNIKYSKWNWYLNGSTYAQTNYRGATLKMGFTGTSLLVNIDVSPLTAASATSAQYPWLRYSIDDGPKTDLQLTSSTSSLFFGVFLNFRQSHYGLVRV